ncbi:MAG: nucleotide exchange factor GrpE [Candidatus Aminicenantales bacterium]|jgi:molecular chaperone GrpE
MTDDDKKKPTEEIEYIAEPGAPGEVRPKEKEPAAAEPEKTEPAAQEKEPSQAIKHLKEKLKKREAEIKNLKKEAEDLKDQYLRKLADVENLRKRLEREKNDYFQFALSEVLLEFLGILDNFERALQASGRDADGKTFREGIDLIYRMSMNLLLKRGVRPIEIKDGHFDPALQQAMAVEESAEVQEPRVTEELQKGYMLHNRLLRPSLVKVIIPKKD